MQKLDFSNLSADELLALATEVPENTGPQGTVVMARPQEVAQVLETTPQPQAANSVPPQAPVWEDEETRGRQKLDDPTNPLHIQAIVSNHKKFCVYVSGIFSKLTAKEAMKRAKALKSLGQPVNARIDRGDTVVFW